MYPVTGDVPSSVGGDHVTRDAMFADVPRMATGAPGVGDGQRPESVEAGSEMAPGVINNGSRVAAGLRIGNADRAVRISHRIPAFDFFALAGLVVVVVELAVSA